MCFPFLFVVVLCCSSSLRFLIFCFFSVVFPLLFCLVMLLSVSFTLKKKRRTNKEKRATTKGKNKRRTRKKRKETPQNKGGIWKMHFVLFLFCCLSETSSPQRCKTPKRQGFSLVLFSFSQKSSTIQKQIKTKEQIRGGNLMIYHFGGISLLVCFPFLFFLWFNFFIFFVFSLFFFFLCCFSSLVSFGYFAFCVFLFGAKEGN